LVPRRLGLDQINWIYLQTYSIIEDYEKITDDTPALQGLHVKRKKKAQNEKQRSTKQYT